MDRHTHGYTVLVLINNTDLILIYSGETIKGVNGLISPIPSHVIKFVKVMDVFLTNLMLYIKYFFKK